MTITFDHIYQGLLFIGALFVVIAGVHRWIYKPFKDSDASTAKQIATETAAAAVAPLLEQLGEVRDEVRAIRAEVTTNGGRSLKDVVLATREGQQVLAARFDQHIAESPHGDR